MIDLQTIPKKYDSFCERELGEETIFLSLEGDRIHAIGEVGTFIWKQLDGKTVLEDVLDRICGEFDVSHDQAGTDLLEFISELSRHKLLTAD